MVEEPIGSVGWPGGARAAVSLTYDGGLPDHLLLTEPMLNAFAIPATFYINATQFLDHLRGWTLVAGAGHEIGNHSLHGVTGPLGDLPNWTLEMVENDLQMTEELLSGYLPESLDRSFAFPGPEPTCSEGSYSSVVEENFRWARSRLEGVNHAVFCNPKALRSVAAEGRSGPQLIGNVAEALDLGAWVIFAFESVATGGRSDPDREHGMLLHYLAGHRSELMIAPVCAIANHVATTRGRMTVG